jgi:hypothetical protein
MGLCGVYQAIFPYRDLMCITPRDSPRGNTSCKQDNLCKPAQNSSISVSSFRWVSHLLHLQLHGAHPCTTLERLQIVAHAAWPLLCSPSDILHPCEPYHPVCSGPNSETSHYYCCHGRTCLRFLIRRARTCKSSLDLVNHLVYA